MLWLVSRGAVGDGARLSETSKCCHQQFDLTLSVTDCPDSWPSVSVCCLALCPCTRRPHPSKNCRVITAMCVCV